MNEPTICAKCRHRGYGRGVVPPRTDTDRRGRPAPNPIRPSTRMGDVICLKHPRGREPVDPVSGLGGQPRALYCEDVNKGDCPDYERGVQESDVVGIIVGVAVAACVVLLVIAMLLATGVIQ